MMHHRLPVAALERIPMFAAVERAQAVHHRTNAAHTDSSCPPRCL
jgi:hypothetical protein